MKTIIVYSSTHGTTEKIIGILKQKLTGEVETVDLKKSTSLNIESYDRVIIGGSIHAGSLQSKVKEYVEKHLSSLLKKEIGLFIVCMYECDQAQKQFENAYPEELRSASLANGLFGGEFLFEKMNFFERLIVKKVSGFSSTVSRIDHDAIGTFIEAFNAD